MTLFIFIVNNINDRNEITIKIDKIFIIMSS
jgi:hypothetical protein